MSPYNHALESRRRPNGQFGSGSHASAPTASLEQRPEQQEQDAITIDGRDLIRLVSSMVGKQQGRIRINGQDCFDDIVQSACLETIKTYGAEKIPLAPIKQVVSTTISRAQGHINLGSTDRRAMKAFAQERELREDQLGRTLTPREEQDLARQIRDTWPDSRHRPSSNFLERARLAQTGQIYREDGTLIEGHNPWTDGESIAVDPDGPLGRAEAALNSGSRRNARKDAWDALAELRNRNGERVPRVLADTHSERVASWCRTVLDDYPGGVKGAVDTWQRAEEDEGTIALFAPFGDIDEQGRDAVCRMLNRHPQAAEDLWAAAMSRSTRNRSTREAA